MIAVERMLGEEAESKLLNFHQKVASGHRTAVRKLLRDDTLQIDMRNNRDETALHLAAGAGDPVVCELLIKAGANIYASRGDGQTPLHIATASDNIECVAVLLKYGSNPRLRDKSGRYTVDLIRSPSMAEMYIEFFTHIRNNPAMLSLVEKTLLWKDIDEIMSVALSEMQTTLTAQDGC